MITVKHIFLNEAIIMQVSLIGQDLLVQCYGGNEFHIGGVSLATAYKNNNNGISVSVSTISAEQHQDYLISSSISKVICKSLNLKTVVICGIHYPSLSKEELSSLMALVEEMTLELIRRQQCGEY